jgi:hypothetical protein
MPLNKSAIWQAVDDGRILAYLAATALTNIFYVGRRISGLQSAHVTLPPRVRDRKAHPAQH